MEMEGKNLFKKISSELNPPQEKKEEAPYPLNTQWSLHRESLVVSSDGVKREYSEWLSCRWDSVTIRVHPNGDVDFALNYPFDDISQEEKRKLIDKVKEKFSKVYGS